MFIVAWAEYEALSSAPFCFFTAHNQVILQGGRVVRDESMVCFMIQSPIPED